MPPEAVLAAIVFVPVVLLMVLRVNAALVFLSLCLGSVLVQFAAGDTNSLISIFSARAPGSELPDNNTLNIVLLLLPAVLTTLFMIKTVRRGGKLVINILPAAGVGLLAALLVVPLLPPGLSDNITNSSLWASVDSSKGYFVSAAAAICLIVLWLQRPKTGGEGKHGKHKG